MIWDDTPPMGGFMGGFMSKFIFTNFNKLGIIQKLMTHRLQIYSFYQEMS